jgi:uncharacterized protein YecE (DUF72 family)
MAGRTFIGTSGWNYDSWKGDFYEHVPKKSWLEYAASRFSGLEVNATFYREQSEKTYLEWLERTPPDFVFAAKAHRFATHSKRLKDPEDTVPRIAENMRPFLPKLAVVLWQLPGNAVVNIERLDVFGRTLSEEWPDVRHVVEFRHPSWFADDVAQLLTEFGLASCMSDAADWPLWEAITTDVVYVRLHGHTRTYASRYSTRSLETWADRVEGWTGTGHDVHVYFDNDQEGAAPHDALRLLELVGGA